MAARAVMVLLSLHGLSPAQIAVLLEYDPATERRSIGRFTICGAAGLDDWPRCGRPRLGGSRLGARISALLKQPGLWTVPRLHRYLGRPKMSPRTLYRRLRKVAVWQRPELIARGDPARPAVVAIAKRLRPLPVGTLVWAADGDLPWSCRVVRLENCACVKLEGWPSFFDAHNADAVELVSDHSHGMVRTEVRCARCGSHLGHVFEGEGYQTPTDQRYCINSISMRLIPDEE